MGRLCHIYGRLTGQPESDDQTIRGFARSRYSFVDPTDLAPLWATSPLSLSPAPPHTGTTLTASFVVHNQSSQPLTLQGVALRGTGPGNAAADFPASGPVTIAAGQDYHYSAARAFEAAGDYTFYAATDGGSGKQSTTSGSPRRRPMRRGAGPPT